MKITMTTKLSDETALLPDEPASVRASALIGFAVCEAAGRLHIWNPALLCLSFLAAFLSGAAFSLCLPCVAAAACHAYFAWRLAFDRPIFAAWARGSITPITAATAISSFSG
ncbi:MAG: hypothetical protein LBU76_01615 [Azoarcus sp.]|jgi:hypothetical protein|nr:hypothetical protein [Azoarcus sp.]